jgi:hypothetical protein
MAKRVIKEKDTKKAIKEKIDNKKDRISTKILISLASGIILAITGYGISQLVSCGMSSCYLGGAGAGSVIVVVIWLITNHLKP